MASRENSSMNEGQMWNTWADCVGLLNGDSDEDDGESEKNKIESDSMKLRKDDMPLFGLCPAWDDFFLAVCELCGYVVKPQSLKTHIELRHGNTSLVRNERSEAAVQHSKSTAGKGTSSITSHTMPNKSSSSQGTKSSSSSSPRHHSKSTNHSHSSHSIASHSSSNLSSGSKPERTKTTAKSKRNNSMAPIVRMERISSSLVKRAATPPPNSSAAEKKELPSPQQPPPVSPASLGIISSSTSGPGPGQAFPMISLAAVVTPSSPNNRQLMSAIASHTLMKPEGPLQGLKKQTSSSKTKKAPKERKLLLCKDREYDPNKHCGVIIADTGKPCTRSLTCKTHSLSLRRAVIGRKKIFDDLLSDHRAAKEATVKGASVKGSSAKSHSRESIENHLSIECEATAGIPAAALSTKNSSGIKVNASSTSGPFRLPQPPPISAQTSGKAAQGIPSNRIPSNIHGFNDSLNLDTSNEERKEAEQNCVKGSFLDPPYITKHPKPAAVCTFGMRHLGNGLLMVDRHWDFPRAAVRAAISAERNSHPPPLKKLCVESRLPPVPEPVDPSDPYSFTCSETSAATSSVPQINMSKSAIAVSNPTDLVHSVSVVPTPNSKANKTTPAPSNHLTTHKPAQPKIVGSKIKERTSVPSNKTLLTNLPSGSNKKKRTSANVPNGTSGVSKSTVLPSLSTTGGTVTLSQAVPLSFPLTIGDHLGALSRLQVAGRNSITLSPAIIRNTGITTLSGASSSATAKDGSLMVTGIELNGQIPVSSALLHSVTVSRPSGSGFGITLGAAGLMGQLSQLPKSVGVDGDTNSLSNSNSCSNKNSHALSSMLNNTHILNSVGNPIDSSWSRTKAKSKVRKNVKSVVNSASHPSNISESTLSSVLQNSIHANILGVTNVSPSPHPLSSPSAVSPHLRTESTSPQVPTSSPLHNGLGPSPPPFLSPKGISISATMGSGQQMSASATSRSSTPSPGIDMSPPISSGNGHKGKNANRLPTSLPKQSTIASSHNTFQVLPMSFSTVSFGGSAMPGAGTESGQPVSYQQVFASHTLSTAQLHQLKLQPGNRHHGSKTTSSKSPGSLSLSTSSLPLKLPLLTASGITSSGKQSLRLPNDVAERTAVTKQGSPFPNNLK